MKQAELSLIEKLLGFDTVRDTSINKTLIENLFNIDHHEQKFLDKTFSQDYKRQRNFGPHFETPFFNSFFSDFLYKDGSYTIKANVAGYEAKDFDIQVKIDTSVNNSGPLKTYKLTVSFKDSKKNIGELKFTCFITEPEKFISVKVKHGLMTMNFSKELFDAPKDKLIEVKTIPIPVTE